MAAAAGERMTSTTPGLTAAVVTLVLGVAVVAGATVAICLGHIGEATYIALVGPLAGGGLVAGVHAAGVNTGAQLSAAGTSAGTSAQ